ncbi:phosphatidylinositol-3,5-bisphosphate 5-phosphatase [Podila epigama]|nr:phosphatidylinositol-3,5-bisphosphate 5-phosphatase [Podila epigama]
MPVHDGPLSGYSSGQGADSSTFSIPPLPSRTDVINHFFLYETRTRFYIVGTNAPAGTRFRVLKIDRTSAPNELNITEDEVVYSKTEVDDLLDMIANGNRSTGGIREIAKFYGIVGFVRFTEGYYMTIVTKRSSVALIGGHYVFHIDATSTISIHNSTTPTSKLDKNSDEARYLQMYQMVDLTKNFYFSYSYDITRTLQANMTRWRVFSTNPISTSTSRTPEPTMTTLLHGSNGSHPSSSSTANNKNQDYSGSEALMVSGCGRNKMFVWNLYLLENGFGENAIDNQWALPIMYGFGYVANDVETEQIVSEMSTTSFYGAGTTSVNPNHTSFVQHRGSIPLFWTQDGTNMSPKPPIELSVVDPYFTAAALHFDDMFKRYGAPCIVLNLIKAKEKTPRESILLKEFIECIEYLNQFLPEDKKIQHIKWDMSRASKSPSENVISVLEIIAERTFARTGFFHTGYSQQQQTRQDGQSSTPCITSGLQNGVVRTNCIDCLDRTNAAQFIIAKCALGHQLHSLGLIAEPFVPFDCDVVNMLTEMYHDHGDTIALQYGGSHLVNTMETYRKINQWTSHSRDMIESIRRFYSNSFVDAEKQDAMNLFLGNFVVQKGKPALWELPGDYHLHNITDPEMKKIRKSYTNWFTPDAILPQDELIHKRLKEFEQYQARRLSTPDGGRYSDYEEYEVKGVGVEDGKRNPQHENEAGTQGRNDDEHLQHFELEGPTGSDQIERLRSDDEEDGTKRHSKSLDEFGWTQSIGPKQSHLSSATLAEKSGGEGGAVSSIHPSLMSSIHQGQESQQQHDSQEPLLPHPSLGGQEADGTQYGREINKDAEGARSGSTISTGETIPDFRERVVAPFQLAVFSQEKAPSSLMPVSSSSSSISSSIRKDPLQSRTLLHHSSRSSMTTTGSLGGGRGLLCAPEHFSSKGEEFFASSWYACDRNDDGSCANDSSAGVGANTAWDEYWDEYYRPKVQTSFQRLFAYNMNSSNRYIPPSVKKPAEQSPFEVRQNQGILSQAEINAKAAAKSEKPSMLSWLGLKSGGNNDKGRNGGVSTKAGAASAYANGSKTLPLSTGRKKGLLASLADPIDDSPNLSKQDTQLKKHKDGAARYAQGSRLSVPSFPSAAASTSPLSVAGTLAEQDEKVSIAGSSFMTNRTAVPDEKVRLPAHVSRSKEEEFELTKNIWTNIPKFAIHDASFVPSRKSSAEQQSADKGRKESIPADTVGSGSGHIGEGFSKGRSGIEELVKKSLMPDVTSQETREYKRYTQQFKSIKFDSVPTKGAASYGINAYASQRDEWLLSSTPHTATGTPLYGSVANGLSSLQQQQSYQIHGQSSVGNDRAKQSRPQSQGPISTSSSASGTNIRLGSKSVPQLQEGSSAVIGLTEYDERYYSSPTATAVPALSTDTASGERDRIQISTARTGRESARHGAADGASLAGAFSAVMSPLSPVTLSPLTANGIAQGMMQDTAAGMPDIQGEPDRGINTKQGDNTPANIEFLSQPPILSSVTHDSQTEQQQDSLSYLPEPAILIPPIQTVIKPPTETELYLYNAHVELPKITLYTVGQTSLNPYWGASSGTRARYDAYQGWIQKGRYGNAPSAAAHVQAQAVSPSRGLNGTKDGVEVGDSVSQDGRRNNTMAGAGGQLDTAGLAVSGQRSIRRGSSGAVMYQALGEMVGTGHDRHNQGGQLPKHQQQQQQQQQQGSRPK